MGDGKECANLLKLAQHLDLSNVTFTGALPKALMPEVLAASDACVAIFKDIPMFRMIYPNKVFDYMAAGRPTILAIDGVIRQVVEKAEGGIFVPPGDDVSLAAAIQALSEDPQRAVALGTSARVSVVERFNRQDHAFQFLNLAQRLTGEKKINNVVFSYKRTGKRLLDLTLTLPAFVVTLPLMGFVALLIRTRLGSPVFFRQRRAGLDGPTLYNSQVSHDDRQIRRVWATVARCKTLNTVRQFVTQYESG